MTRSNAYIGSPLDRIEDLRLLAGAGTFVGDLKPDNLLYAVILRSPISHGRIRKIGTAAARSLQGVAAVITAAEIGEVPIIPVRQHGKPEGEPYRQPVIAGEKVRYVGEPVAVVIASEQCIAEDAAELIELEIDELPAVATHEIAARDQTLLFENTVTNLATTFYARMGDADMAFATAEYKRKEKFSVHRHTASPMETRGLLAEWNPELQRMVVSGATKVPFFNRNVVAEMLRLQPSQVDLIEVDVGGGFGARGEFYPEDFLIPFAARYVGGNVRWVEDRREHLMAMNHAREMYADLEIACRKDGTLVGVRGRIDIDLGAYVRTNGFTTPRNVVQFVSGPYLIPNIAIDAFSYLTSKTPTGTYRGPGRYEASFFCERLLDMAANDLGIDPAEFRLKNLIPEDQLPRPLATMAGLDRTWQTELDNGAYGVVMERCLKEFGWEEKKKLQGQLIDGRYHGIAVGNFVEGGAGGRFENARMTIEKGGTVTVAVGSTALGQGLQTILSQIAADALSMPIERIRLLHGSTTLVTQGFGSFHSRSTVMGGSAILLAAEALVALLRDKGASHFGCEPDQVSVSDGYVYYGTKSMEFSAFAGSEVERQFENRKLTYSYGSHTAHVAVDPGTGHVELLDYMTVDDVGRIINPATLHGQILGAIVQGLGSTFLEHLQYDENGQLLTGSLADYLLPTATDFPNIRGISLGLRPCPNNPLGAKGAGEGGLIAVGGVIGNAIAAALRSMSVEPRDLPLSPPQIWRLIQQAKASNHNPKMNEQS
ncbi:xanthine dehydrogenase family protein molybdopterin-binding subunit [Bradyrhizobium sp. dw_78]|uniref:xanthine dehydrogenase family protein molybdopterin-binding subunit n=1 Tax=Bradyrhizobium sp. dw_78 TaxID=2719793 RepID=UPI001BD41BAC|nr:xanthine dehydrogenase family protein molybdopterin-binding subunit [Bradyrhizobium sp. dw_78]